MIQQKDSGGYDEKASANASELEKEIEVLTSSHWQWFVRDYRGFWTHAREISRLFKTLRPLRRNDREELWRKFGSACEKIKNEQNDYKEKRTIVSERHRGYILGDAEKARPVSFFGFGFPNVETMKELGKLLREASMLLSRSKHEMFAEHKQECFDRIKEIREIHEAWWDESYFPHLADRHFLSFAPS